jgi:hypothetical protein
VRVGRVVGAARRKRKSPARRAGLVLVENDSGPPDSLFHPGRLSLCLDRDDRQITMARHGLGRGGYRIDRQGPQALHVARREGRRDSQAHRDVVPQPGGNLLLSYEVVPPSGQLRVMLSDAGIFWRIRLRDPTALPPNQGSAAMPRHYFREAIKAAGEIIAKL